MSRGSTGFHSGPVSSQLEMARRPLPCGSDMREEEVRGDSWSPGMAEISWVEHVKAFNSERRAERPQGRGRG